MTHPTRDTLGKYLAGRLSPDEAATLDQHIETCGDCGRVLGTLDSDTLTQLVRQSGTKVQHALAESNRGAEIPAELRDHPRYDIHERLGQGGMGVVYRATHRMMNRPVALKLIRTDLLASPVAVERFRREVQAAAKLAHANIVTAYDAEEVAGIHFLVMEYVEGRTLDRIVAKKGPLPVPLACHLMRQAALGLDHAHAQGMVHRDIKPHNLIVTNRSKLKILDFGLARMAEAEMGVTREQSAMGTLRYAAPEQLYRTADVDARADQYGLGATLYFLLAGQPPPLPSREDAKTLSFESPQGLPATVPAGVRAIVEKLLSDAPADRYPNAKAVADALAPWASARTLSTRSPRRRLWPAAAGVMVLAAIIAWASTRKGRETSDGNTSATTTTTAQESTKVPNEEWRSLFPRIDVKRDAIAGAWSLTRDGLKTTVTANEPAARLMLGRPGAEEYDLWVRFTRTSGRHSVGVILASNGKQCTFELDAWNQNLAGFQNLSGLRITENPSRRPGYQLSNGRKYELIIEVRRQSVVAKLDGREVTQHISDGRDWSLDPQFWTIPDSSSLAVIAYESDVIFHAIEMRVR